MSENTATSQPSEATSGRPQEDGELVAPASRWLAIRSDERFVELMRLARAANSLPLAFGPVLHALDDQSPKARRDRFAAMFYAAALLKEALDTTTSLARWYRDHPHYRTGIGAIAADAAVQRLVGEYLTRVRHKFVYHYDRDVIADGLRRLRPGDITVMSFSAPHGAYGDTYFDVADAAMEAHLFDFDHAADDALHLTRTDEFMLGVQGLIVRFVDASHRLITAGLIELGCQKRRVTRRSDQPAGLR